MSTQGLGNTFLAAIQASLSVLLVIAYGAVSAHYDLLDAPSAKKISKICVRVFLPALLFTDIGSQLHVESVRRYGIILLWALICHFVSFVLGSIAHLVLGMPDWITVALMFNNTTSYPLLLIEALNQTGILKELVQGDETVANAIARARSYFLVFATVSSCLTFAVGPRLIDTEHAPEPDKEGGFQSVVEDASPEDDTDETAGLLSAQNRNTSAVSFFPSSRRPSTFFPSDRRPSSLPTFPVDRRASVVPKPRWQRLSPRTQWWLLFISDFFNAPLLGAVAGTLVGLVPVLQRAFFNDTAHGGIFTAWLTASLKSIGGLFVPLPVLIAGVSLYLSVKQARSSGTSSSLPWGTTSVILFVRFVLWPVISIATIYLLCTKTEFLGNDSILWFTMMLMPTGPSAIKLINMIQIADASEEEEHMIAKLLTVSRLNEFCRTLLMSHQVSYVISPILSITVVASLKASEAGLRS